MTREELIMSADFFALREAKTAWRHTGGRLELDDFVQAARLGVIQAADTYDPEQGSFTTWSHFQIRKQLQELQKLALPVYIPGRAYAEMSREDRARYYKGGVSLSAPIKSTQGVTTVGDTLEDRGHIESWSYRERKNHLKTIVLMALIQSSLTDRERSMIESAYGLKGQPECSFVEIADQYGVTRQRITQIMQSSHKKIKRAVLRVVGKEANLVAFL